MNPKGQGAHKEFTPTAAFAQNSFVEDWRQALNPTRSQGAKLKKRENLRTSFEIFDDNNLSGAMDREEQDNMIEEELSIDGMEEEEEVENEDEGEGNEDEENEEESSDHSSSFHQGEERANQQIEEEIPIEREEPICP